MAKFGGAVGVKTVVVVVVARVLEAVVIGFVAAAVDVISMTSCLRLRTAIVTIPAIQVATNKKDQITILNDLVMTLNQRFKPHLFLRARLDLGSVSIILSLVLWLIVLSLNSFSIYRL